MSDFIIHQTIIDGRIFFYSNASLKNNSTIAYYFADDGRVYPIQRESVYGEMLLHKVGGKKNDKYVLVYYYDYNDNSDPIWNCIDNLEKEVAETRYDSLRNSMIDIRLLKQIKEK